MTGLTSQAPQKPFPGGACKKGQVAEGPLQSSSHTLHAAHQAAVALQRLGKADACQAQGQCKDLTWSA